MDRDYLDELAEKRYSEDRPSSEPSFEAVNEPEPSVVAPKKPSAIKTYGYRILGKGAEAISKASKRGIDYLNASDERRDKKLLNDIDINIADKMDVLTKRWKSETDEEKKQKMYNVLIAAKDKYLIVKENFADILETFANALNDNPVGGKRRSKTRRRKHKKSKSTRRR